MTSFQKPTLSDEQIASIASSLTDQSNEALRQIMDAASRDLMALSAERHKDKSVEEAPPPSFRELEAQMTALISHQRLCFA